MSDQTRLRRADWAALAGLILLAAALRLVYAAGDRVVWGDEPFYLWIGRSLWAGEGYGFFGYSGAHFPPLFPLMAGGLARLTGNLQAASDLIYAVAGALLTAPLFLLVRSTVNPAAAWMTGLVVALYPALASGVLAWGTMTEPLYLLWVGLAIFQLYRALDDQPVRWTRFALLGLFLGLAYLTRTEALVLAVAFFGLALIGRLLRRDRLAAVLGRLTVAAVVFLALAAPWLAYLRGETGRWSLSGSAGMAFTSMAGLAQDDPAAFDRATWGVDPASGEVYLFAQSSEEEPLLPALAADPVGLLRRLRSGFGDALALFFSVKLAPWLLTAIALLGLLARPWDKRRLRGEAALIVSLTAPAAYVPFFVQERYLAGALIPLMAWLGIGLWVVGDWLAGTWANLRARPLSSRQSRALTSLPALALAALLVALGPLVWQRMQRTHSFQPAHLAAADALRGLGVTADTTVMSRYPAIAFHAGTRWAPTPFAAWPDIAAYAREHGAQYIVLDGWEANLRPEVAFLLTPGLAPDDLRYVMSVDDGDDPALIYEFQ